MLLALLVAALVVVGAGIVAAVLLALGTVLALIFAVSVWQATIVAAVAAGGLVWLLTNLLWAGEVLPEPPDEEPPVRLSVQDPVGSARAGRKRRR